MDHNRTQIKHLISLATLVGTLHGEFLLFAFIEGMIKTASEPGGILDKVKNKYQITEYMESILKTYYQKLKPVGGSYAGARIAGRETRSNDESSSSNPEDPTCKSNLAEVIKAVVTDSNLDDKVKQELNESAAYLRLILEKSLGDPILGLRKHADKFMSFQPTGMDDAFEILDEMMQELRPLEILIQGPDQLLILEYTHSSSHNASLRVDEIAGWRDTLLRSFRSSTPTTTMNDTVLLDRRIHLLQLAYMTTPSFESRLRLLNKQHGGNTTYHAIRTEVQPIINRIINSPRMTGTQILDLTRPILKMYSGANIKTMRWTDHHQRTNNGNNRPFYPTKRSPQAHTVRATEDGRPHQDTKRDDHHARPARHDPRHGKSRSESYANDADPKTVGWNTHTKKKGHNFHNSHRFRNKESNPCHLCGEPGHWASDCPRKQCDDARCNTGRTNNEPKKILKSSSKARWPTSQ